MKPIPEELKREIEKRGMVPPPVKPGLVYKPKEKK